MKPRSAGEPLYRQWRALLQRGPDRHRKRRDCQPWRTLLLTTYNFHDPAFPLVAADIEVRVNAWVATEAFVVPGVLVGTNAVVEARALATESTPDDVTMAGNPAPIVRHQNIT